MRQLEDGQYIPKNDVYIGQRVWYGKLYLTRSYKKSKEFLLPLSATVKSKDFLLVDTCDKKKIYCPSYFYGYECWSFFKNKEDLILSWNTQVTNTLRDIKDAAERIRDAYSRGGYYYESITKRKALPSFTNGEMIGPKDLNDKSVKKFYFDTSRKVLYGTELPLDIRGTFNSVFLPNQNQLGKTILTSVFPTFEDASFYYSKYGVLQVLDIVNLWETSTTKRIKALYI